MKIVRNTNCGNSPKNAFIEKFTIEFLKGELPENKIIEKVSLEIAGGKEYIGKKDFRISHIIDEEIREAIIFDPISHGKKGAIDLEISTPLNRYSMGVFIEFKTVKADVVSKLKIFLKPHQSDS